MNSQVTPVKTIFTPSDLKLFVYGNRQTDQFWLPSSTQDHSKKPFCLTDIQKFTINNEEEDNQQQNKAQVIPNLLFNQTVFKIACGSIHSIVLTIDGRVFTFGCNDEGALGRKGVQCIPIQVKLEDPIDLIAAGDNHSLFANSVNGAIYFTGNYNYKRGQKMTDSVFEPTRTYAHEINIHNKHKKIEKLACGCNHSAFLIGGKIFCRGEPDASTIGRRMSKRHKIQNSLTFNGVNISNVVDIQCGGYHTVAKTVKNGKIKYYAWGTNDHGQLGIGSYDNQTYPTQIKKLKGVDVCQITAGSQFTLFLTSQGTLYGCGNNEYSNLGLGQDFQYESEISENEQSQDQQKNKQDNKIVNQQANHKNNSEKMQQQINKQPILKPQQISLPAQVKSADQMKDQMKPPTPAKSIQNENVGKILNEQQAKNKMYIRTPVKIELPEPVTNIGAGENFAFAWNKQSLYSWGLGYGYVLLNGEQNDQAEPFKVKNKIINNHSIYQLDAGSQHVLFTSYPDTIDRASVKIEPKPSVWENLSIAKHGLKRKR